MVSAGLKSLNYSNGLAVYSRSLSSDQQFKVALTSRIKIALNWVDVQPSARMKP